MVALVDKSSSVGYKPEASWIISTLGCRSESYPFTYHYQCHEIPQWNLEGHGWIGWKSGGIRVVIAPLSPKKTTTICDKLNFNTWYEVHAHLMLTYLGLHTVLCTSVWSVAMVTKGSINLFILSSAASLSISNLTWWTLQNVPALEHSRFL